MARNITIHKPTHKWFGPNGTPAIAIGQLRGDRLYLNRFESGMLVEKISVIGSCAYRMTGYGKGVKRDDTNAHDAMQSAYEYAFGPDVTAPEWCERHIVYKG